MEVNKICTESILIVLFTAVLLRLFFEDAQRETIMAPRYSLDYFIESIQEAITLKQLNDISIEFDKNFLSGNLNLHDEDWAKFTIALNTKINLLSNQSRRTTPHDYA